VTEDVPADSAEMEMEEMEDEEDMGHLEEYDEDMAEWEEQEWNEYNRNQIVGRNASIFFMTVALLKGLYHYNLLFRYFDIPNFWDNSEVGDGPNWWKLANQIQHWAGFVGFATMGVSQLLSLIIGLGKINYIIWGWGLTLFGLAAFTYQVMAGVAYERAYQVIRPRRSRRGGNDSDDDTPSTP